jgi:hypothetical protein
LHACMAAEIDERLEGINPARSLSSTRYCTPRTGFGATAFAG